MDHHYLLRIFRHRRNSEDETSSSVDTEDSKQRPKLERRNANKNIDYDPFASPSSSVPSSDGVGVPSSLRTRSLDINPFEKNTSFRIEGVDGEIDRLCETLGLSGPEDFTIPAAAWEARKARSASDIFPRSRFSKDECVTNQKNEDEGLEEATVRVTDEAEAEALLGLSTSTLDDSQDFRNSPDVGASPPSNYGVCGGGATGSGRGIKGVRPPLLTPPPLKGRYVDNMSTASTWDIMMSLAPERGSSSCPVRISESGSSDKDDEVGVSGEGEVLNEGETGGEKDEHENEARLGETAITSDSTTFLTSNDEDSSSATTETTYSISPEGTFRRNITSWQRGDIVGRGSFGTVFEAFTEDGFFFAVKEISLLDQSQQSVQQLEQEIALLKEFEHENIVQYLGTDRQEGKLYIFLELVKGSLVDVYRKYHLGDSQVSAYTRQILNGLKYLHDQNVVHRDIKCANILVHTSGSVKLADFGLAKAIKLNDLKSCKGTAFWMAPEVINRKMHGYGIAADIWSLGCTVLEMLTRVPPYSPLEPMQAVFRIGQGILPTIPDDLSRDARDFISQCLQVNPENRPSAVQLLNNPFVQPPLPGSLVSGSPSHHNSGRS